MNLDADLGDLSAWSTEELKAALALVGEHLDGLLEKAAPLTDAEYQARMDALYQRIDQRVTAMAERLAAGRISPAKFRSQMAIQLRQSWVGAYRMGARAGARQARGDNALRASDTLLSAQDHQYLDNLWQQQQAYLDSFAQAAGENDYSRAYLLWRSRLYPNALHKAYWMGKTSRFPSSWQVEYIARDDRDTCGPCRFNAENGPYAPDECPMPGEDCLGHNNCRCTLRYERVSAELGAEEAAGALTA